MSWITSWSQEELFTLLDIINLKFNLLFKQINSIDSGVLNLVSQLRNKLFQWAILIACIGWSLFYIIWDFPSDIHYILNTKSKTSMHPSQCSKHDTCRLLSLTLHPLYFDPKEVSFWLITDWMIPLQTITAWTQTAINYLNRDPSYRLQIVVNYVLL